MAAATRGPRKAVLELSAGERGQLRAVGEASGKTAQALASRSRIVLACAGGASNLEVARRLRVSAATVGKWRSRFVSSRLDGLVDEPRPGRPRTVSDERVEAVIVRTLESAPPDGGTHWSTRQMAAVSGLSQSTISRVWRAFGLQPHRVEQWKLSKDPLFVEKVRDVVGLYLDPPERALVLCVDEKSHVDPDRVADLQLWHNARERALDRDSLPAAFLRARLGVTRTSFPASRAPRRCRRAPPPCVRGGLRCPCSPGAVVRSRPRRGARAPPFAARRRRRRGSRNDRRSIRGCHSSNCSAASNHTAPRSCSEVSHLRQDRRIGQPQRQPL